jgi:hypothetical protein
MLIRLCYFETTYCRNPSDTIRSSLTALHVVLESSLLLHLLQSTGLENNLWLTSLDLQDVNASTSLHQNLSDVVSFNRIYVVGGTESKKIFKVESSNTAPQMLFLCDIKKAGNFVENENTLQPEKLTKNDNLKERKDLSGVHLKIGYISTPSFIECDNIVSLT